MVGRKINGLCRSLDQVKLLLVRVIVQYVIKQSCKLIESHSAGYALTTGLGKTHLNERRRHVHGAGTRGVCHDPALQVLGKGLYGHLGLIFLYQS